MDLLSVTDLTNYVYSVHKQQVVESILGAATNLQTSTRMYNSPVWEQSSTRAKRIWELLHDELAIKGYTVTFEPKSSCTVISWG